MNQPICAQVFGGNTKHLVSKVLVAMLLRTLVFAYLALSS